MGFLSVSLVWLVGCFCEGLSLQVLLSHMGSRGGTREHLRGMRGALSHSEFLFNRRQAGTQYPVVCPQVVHSVGIEQIRVVRDRK